ncbi:MAG: hypothetical protein Q8M17_07070 [Actinomycetota bacterium]|nr:hypothetical protein [Actinomycetota bacterium]
MRRVLSTAAVALATLAVLPAGAPSAAEPMTTITMTVSGCEGCTITPVQAITGATAVYTGSPVKVTGGQAAFVVPTSNTAGMSFNLEATWPVDINAIPVIVTQYKGIPAGQAVTRTQALAARRATACWAGTASSAVSLQVKVGRVKMPGFPSGRTTVPLAWFVPTAATTGGFSRAYKGTIAQQDAWYCPAG